MLLFRKLAILGTSRRLAGSPSTQDGLGSFAQFNGPKAVAWDALSGFLFVVDGGNRLLRKVTTSGIKIILFHKVSLSLFPPISILFIGSVMFVAGGGLPGGTLQGSVDGFGSNVRFYDPRCLAVSSSGIVYVGEYTLCRFRRITPSGKVLS